MCTGVIDRFARVHLRIWLLRGGRDLRHRLSGIRGRWHVHLYSGIPGTDAQKPRVAGIYNTVRNVLSFDT